MILSKDYLSLKNGHTKDHKKTQETCNPLEIILGMSKRQCWLGILPTTVQILQPDPYSS